MRIDSARYESGGLVLTTSDPAARRLAYEFKPGEWEIVKAKKKRSLDANSYAWVLIDKLAAATGYPKSEVYRNAIREIGGNTETICVQKAAAEKLCEGWEHNGMGWQAETMPSKLPGCVNVVLYSGSSTYDVRQMSRLIDNLVEDCRALDIETLPPEKLAAMLEGWGA